MVGLSKQQGLRVLGWWPLCLKRKAMENSPSFVVFQMAWTQCNEKIDKSIRSKRYKDSSQLHPTCGWNESSKRCGNSVRRTETAAQLWTRQSWVSGDHINLGVLKSFMLFLPQSSIFFSNISLILTLFIMPYFILFVASPYSMHPPHYLTQFAENVVVLGWWHLQAGPTKRLSLVCSQSMGDWMPGYRHYPRFSLEEEKWITWKLCHVDSCF